ncbi:hypothetical protein OOU_Y34scaffold00777g17 [Pyricularia oryzae Y34]|uniref:Uncharacterized protein n=3 Tax=Pyricularia oryzae TaxID=318829 RepID=Q2KGT3_PYRO7|nr:hypothetical protein MGCH7_ch7g252 [Pyricularia oryzae 70-15]ELQ34259.1 hypothetical protein OOU_Y34scaffold00777g17 [Pyricularia oryzae Y34]
MENDILAVFCYCSVARRPRQRPVEVWRLGCMPAPGARIYGRAQ